MRDEFANFKELSYGRAKMLGARRTSSPRTGDPRSLQNPMDGGAGELDLLPLRQHLGEVLVVEPLIALLAGVAIRRLGLRSAAFTGRRPRLPCASALAQ